MIDSLENMKAELEHLVQLVRPHYQTETDDVLYAIAMDLRPQVYGKGRLPTDEEIKGVGWAEVRATKLLAEAQAAAQWRQTETERAACAAPKQRKFEPKVVKNDQP